MTENQNQLLEQIANNLATANGETFSNTSNLNSTELLKIIALQTSELVTNGSPNNGSSYPSPHVSKINPNRIAMGFDIVIDIEGSFFTPDTTVSVEGSTVNSVQFVSSNLIKVNLSPGPNQGFFSLTIDNGSSLIVPEALELVDISSLVVDLRAGGTDFSSGAIEMRNGMSWSRFDWGMRFNGSSGWSRWVRFVGDNDQWIKQRNQQNPPNLVMIVQADTGMVGIGSRESNPNSSGQWNQGEIMAYFTTPTNHYGFYGNSGNPGSVATYGAQTIIPSANVILRLEFANWGEPGSTFRISQLPSSSEGWLDQQLLTERQFIAANSPISDWITPGTLLNEITISTYMTANATEIMPFLLPSDPDLNLLGFFYEEN